MKNHQEKQGQQDKLPPLLVHLSVTYQPCLTDMLFDLQKKENTNIPQLKNQLSETEKAIQNMLNAIQAGVLTSSTKQRLEELEEAKSNLEVSLINEEMKKPILSKEQISFWLHKFRKTDITDYEQRQRLVDSFVNAIYLYDDKVILTFNYKDGSKTISLADIECSDLGAGGAPKKIMLYSFEHGNDKMPR